MPNQGSNSGLAAVLSILAASLALLSTSDPAAGQIRASEPATVVQTIDGTEITIKYFRPKARDRSPLFGEGGVVWEHIWTPGANWATTIEFQKPVVIEGEEVEPGTYSMWMLLSEDDLLPEEFFLHPTPKIFHTNGPDPSEAVLRLPLERTEGPFREMLTWDFEDIRTNGATLALQWGTMRIPFDLRVQPSSRQIATAEEAAPVVGAYQVIWTNEEGEETPPFTMVVTHADDGTLHADIEGFPADAEWLNEADFMLLPRADRIFGFGEAWDGVLTEVWPDVMLEFDLGEGPSTTVQFRDEDDRVWGQGKRN